MLQQQRHPGQAQTGGQECAPGIPGAQGTTVRHWQQRSRSNSEAESRECVGSATVQPALCRPNQQLTVRWTLPARRTHMRFTATTGDTCRLYVACGWAVRVCGSRASVAPTLYHEFQVTSMTLASEIHNWHRHANCFISDADIATFLNTRIKKETNYLLKILFFKMTCCY